MKIKKAEWIARKVIDNQINVLDKWVRVDEIREKIDTNINHLLKIHPDKKLISMWENFRDELSCSREDKDGGVLK